MKFFADTAEIADIKELAATGLLDGVTTNPSLIAKSGRDFKQTIAEICAVVGGPVSAEVDERHDEPAALLGQHEIAVKQHGRPDSDRIAVDRGNNRHLVP